MSTRNMQNHFRVPTASHSQTSKIISGHCRILPSIAFTQKAAPLAHWTQKDVPFNWIEDCQEAFDQLKRAFVTPPVLAYPRYDDPFIVTTDASNDAVGMVLSQVQDGKERVIAYGAKMFTKAQKNYDITEKEALSCVLAIRHFEPNLKGTNFKIVTDHSALRWMFDQKKVSGRIARWIAYVQQFAYSVEHKPGKSIGNEDGLSREAKGDTRTDNDLDDIDDSIFPPKVSLLFKNCEENMQDPMEDSEADKRKQDTDEEDKQNAKNELKGVVSLQQSKDNELDLLECTKSCANKPKTLSNINKDLTSHDIRKLQLADNSILPIIHYLEEDIVPSNVWDAKWLAATAQKYEVIDGVLYHLWSLMDWEKTTD